MNVSGVGLFLGGVRSLGMGGFGVMVGLDSWGKGMVGQVRAVVVSI